KKQWSETIKTNPDWILSLDADEIIENGFWDHVQELLNNKDYGFYCFRLYDMWNETSQHCGRFPVNTFSFPKANSEFRVKHLGWATPEDRATKFKRYQLLDPD